MKTQYQICKEAAESFFNQKSFREMADDPVNPLTNQDLERLIACWPERYEMYSGWLGKLKDEVAA